MTFVSRLFDQIGTLIGISAFIPANGLLSAMSVVCISLRNANIAGICKIPILNIHLINLQAVLSELSCHLCFKSFKIKHHLVYHMRVHTGERPYKCELCGLAFTVKSNLDRHLRNQTCQKQRF